MSSSVSNSASVLARSLSAVVSGDPLTKTIKSTFQGAKLEMQAIEARIASCLGSEAESLTEISQYLQQLGGKRVRPLLCILAARLFGKNELCEGLIDTSAGIELIHMATLLHDDIIDQSATRRGKPSAYHAYGLTPTLLTGDFLLVRAFGLCSKLSRFIIEATEDACIALTEGELLEGKLSIERGLTLAEYQRIVDKKTASLFCLASKAGAHLAGAQIEHVELLGEFGTKAGIAFQMIDDILDITANEDLLGKPAGSDLRQHTPSLLNILWLDSGDPMALEYFATASSTTEASKRAMQQILTTPIVEEARSIATKCANDAIETLNQIPSDLVDTTTRTQLEALVEYTLKRCL